MEALFVSGSTRLIDYLLVLIHTIALIRKILHDIRPGTFSV